ncbi:MAG: hypothetical protein KC466_06440 [Myxococcales bacterium]|nr:hypothetical protein [Myxococcales bacterium]
MNLNSMLEKCHRDQWKVGDLDWSRKPRDLSPEDEEAIVQYFTDMAGIERLAGALFEEQRRRETDPVLKEIFRTFVVDEVRHAQAAQMLADFYNLRKIRLYEQSPGLRDFAPAFVEALRHFSPGIANAYVTGGELLLDIALLRSLNDYVADEMSDEVMQLINRDESRHVAIDFHMVEYYASDAYAARARERPRRSAAEEARALGAFAKMLYYARPFFLQVFHGPMEVVDPTHRRLAEAFKRVQLITRKEEVANTTFVKFMSTARGLYQHPIARRTIGPILERIVGLNDELMRDLYTEEEERRARKMSFDEMAEEALDAKHH